MDNKELGSRIAELRKQNNLSQKDLADQLNISNKTISKWECGNGSPDIESLQKLSKIFNITIDELLKNEPDQPMREEPRQSDIKSDSFFHTKKFIILLISLAAILVICISTICFFFIPRDPHFLDTGKFELDENTSTLTLSVNNEEETISLNNSFELPMTNSWKLFRDINGLYEINTKTVNLQVGNNTFYAVVENTAGDSKIYTIQIRRKPLYIVTFDTAGGELIANQFIQEGELLTYITPVKTGYIFDSWNYDFSKPVMGNITITASWIPEQFTIEYFSNTSDNSSIKQDVIYDDTVKLKAADSFYNRGYTLISWNTEPDGSGTTYNVDENISNYKIAGDLKLYAQWQVNQYEIIIHSNNASAGQVTGNGSYNYGEEINLTAITNPGYTLLGWYNSEDELISSSQSLPVQIIDESQEFFARWQANEYEITLDVSGGNKLDENIKTVVFGTEFNLPIATKTEANFLGWFTEDNKQYTDMTGDCKLAWNIPTDTTLYAHYKMNEYQVNLTQNVVKGGKVSGEGLKEYGSTVTVVAHTNAGYTFKGWYDGQKLIAKSESYQFEMPNFAVTYTAQWSPNTYTVLFDTTGGQSLDQDSQDVIFDTTFSFPIPVRTGYTFEGWYTTSNNAGTAITDADGNALTEWNMANDTTLFAKWDTITYSISYNLNGGTVNIENKKEYTIEDGNIYLTNPSKPGYIFAGWVGTDLAEATKNLIIPAGSIGNRIYGAVWEENSSFTPIGSVEDFLKINNNLSGNYYLTNDIDLNGISFTGFGSEKEPFSGIFDGKGHIISNYGYSNLSDSANFYFGIFNYNSGLIKNIGVTNYSICINAGFAGGLIGYNSGIVINSFTDGQIVSSRYSGGLVSYNSGEIKNCYTKGIINAHEQNWYETDVYAGGIAAFNDGIIRNVYSTANINANRTSRTSGSFRAGGLVGNTSSTGIISNSFATGNVVARGDKYALQAIAGNIVGSSQYLNNIISCYYLETQIIEAYQGLGFDHIVNVGTPTGLNNLYNINGLSWQAYINDINLWVHDESVWILNENDYPSLYWEKEIYVPQNR